MPIWRYRSSDHAPLAGGIATARKQGDFDSLPEHVKARIRGNIRAKFKRETHDYDQLLAFLLANQSWDICQSLLSALSKWNKLTPLIR